ncbi:hypothetical protein HanPSC8_Chr16g0720771 [Helianthus annuus]|nr:hypothetical protein HanIR_Chr16g0817081 [Helianthus annuus]KAJ0821484.1 hypothetical protein HanPSC8_Chr16g0720771 [Helianthus annuus]
MVHRPSFLCPNLKQLSSDETNELVVPFTVQVIKDAIWECDNDRAPGPDGFNFGFNKHFWEVLKDDSVKIMDSFYNNGAISHRWGSSFFA